MSSRQRSRGAALIIALVFLLAMTVLALSTSTVSVQQERMAGNYRESTVAMLNAEARMRELEIAVLGQVTGTGGLEAPPVLWSAFWEGRTQTAAGDCTLSSVYGPAGAPTWSCGANPEKPPALMDLSSTSEGTSGLDEVYGNPCGPMNSQTSLPLGQHYLITVDGVGEREGDRGACTVLQTIFFWPN